MQQIERRHWHNLVETLLINTDRLFTKELIRTGIRHRFTVQIRIVDVGNEWFSVTGRCNFLAD